MAITNKQIEELKERKRLINLQLELYNKGKQKDEDDVQYALTEKALAMAEKMAATKGVKDIASSSIINSSLKQNKKTPKSARLKRDPQFSKVPPNQTQPLKDKEPIADIFAKIYNLMRRDYARYLLDFRKKKKEHLQAEKTKERRISELIELFGGKYKSKHKNIDIDRSGKGKKKEKSLVKYGLIIAAFVAAIKSAYAKFGPSTPEGGTTTPFTGTGKTFNDMSDAEQDEFLKRQAHAEGSDKPGSVGNRHNNPGNIIAKSPTEVYPAQAKFGGVPGETIKGGDGKTRTFVRFPDWQSGVAAQKDLWKRKYGNVPIDDALKKWVDPSSRQEIAGYKSNMGVSAENKMPAPVTKEAANTPEPAPKKQVPKTQISQLSTPKTTNIPVALEETTGGQASVTVLNKITNINNGSDVYAMEDPGTYISPFLDKQYNYKV